MDNREKSLTVDELDEATILFFSSAIFLAASIASTLAEGAFARYDIPANENEERHEEKTEGDGGGRGQEKEEIK